ncbi:hypothetical protein B0T13DRAFT_445456 [Neurospora crassa]|nr:hypothetical protein B0T13DRAFT_445456 [Neurospora crassa]
MGPPFSMKEAVNGSMPPCLRDCMDQCKDFSSITRFSYRFIVRVEAGEGSSRSGLRFEKQAGQGNKWGLHAVVEWGLVDWVDWTGRAGQNGQSLGRTQTMFFVDDYGKVQLRTGFGKYR